MSHRDRSEPAAAAAASSSNAASSSSSSDSSGVADIKSMLTNCTYPQMKTLGQTMMSEFAKQAKHMYATHVPLTDVTCAWLKRAGRAGEESVEGKKKLVEWENRLITSVKRQHELLQLNTVLNQLMMHSQTGHMTPDSDWGDWFTQAHRTHASTEEERFKIEAAIKKALDKFRDDCWKVNHAGEARVIDDELAIQSNAVVGRSAFRCPLSQDYYENPMRNQHCDHVFSKDGIQAMLQHKQNTALKRVAPLDVNFSTTCPLCTNKVSMSSLFEAKDIERQTAQHKRKEKERKERGELPEEAAAEGGAASNKRKRGGVKQERQSGYDDLTQQQNEETQQAGDDDDQGGEEEEEEPAAPAAVSRSSSRKK